MSETLMVYKTLY